MALLKEHGISMQEDTDNSLITSALQSGRQLVLSDAGKLFLNDPNFKNTLPSKQSIPTPSLPSSKTPVVTKPSTGPPPLKFDYLKKKPTILGPNTKTMPLETNKVITFSAVEVTNDQVRLIYFLLFALPGN